MWTSIKSTAERACPAQIRCDFLALLKLSSRNRLCTGCEARDIGSDRGLYCQRACCPERACFRFGFGGTLTTRSRRMSSSPSRNWRRRNLKVALSSQARHHKHLASSLDPLGFGLVWFREVSAQAWQCFSWESRLLWRTLACLGLGAFHILYG